MNFMKTRIQLVLLSSVLAMPTLPHRQSTMLQVLLPSGHRTTKSFDINLANLRQFNIYEADVPRLLAVLDQDDQVRVSSTTIVKCVQNIKNICKIFERITQKLPSFKYNQVAIGDLVNSNHKYILNPRIYIVQSIFEAIIVT